jgi:sulfate permease, SulP family
MSFGLPPIVHYIRQYDRRDFFSDLAAGVTVGVVALPLAIGFGIASGVTPAQGLWTAIIGGFFISALGGSKVQIGGPTGAFVPILAAVVAKFGYEGLAVATVLAGIFLLLMGLLKLGSLIKFIPYPVVAGFTSGIAVIIFIGQLKEFLGLSFELPLHTLTQISAIVRHASQFHWPALLIGVVSLAIILLWPRRWRVVPGSIVAIVVPTAAVAIFSVGVETIGSKFGGIPQGFPGLHFPAVTFSSIEALIPAAMTIAMLGAIESLLSAMVADGMIEAHHDSNQELIGQGVTNCLCPLFGGISATGAIARTATSVRSGARTPMAGIFHSITLLVIVLIAAPLAKFVPLSALSAVLLVVAYRMGEWDNFITLARGPKSDFWVLLVTFALTITFDLTIAVGAGLVMAGVLFVKRMEEITHIRLVTGETEMELGGDSIRDKDVPEGVLVYRIEGPFFFGVAEKLEEALARSLSIPPVVIFRMRNVPAIDATGLRALEVTFQKFQRRGTKLILSGVQAQPMKVLFNAGFVDAIGLDNFCADIDDSLSRARKLVATGESA